MGTQVHLLVDRDVSRVLSRVVRIAELLAFDCQSGLEEVVRLSVVEDEGIDEIRDDTIPQGVRLAAVASLVRNVVTPTFFKPQVKS